MQLGKMTGSSDERLSRSASAAGSGSKALEGLCAALLPPEAIARAVERTRGAGAEIVGLLKNASAYCAPGAALCEMVAAVLHDKGRLLPAPAYLQGEYGLSGLYTGVPIVLDGGGVRRVVEVPLQPEERAAFLRSAEEVRSALAELPQG